MGIAPECNIVGVKVLDKLGRGNSADVLAGIQWVYDNLEKYDIRILNLSVGSTDVNKNDPLVKAVEALWDRGVVVTAAAGNNGPTPCSISSPGISKKIITVGSANDDKKVEIWGDDLVNFSGRGPTLDCIMKPDVIAPGVSIVSCLTSTPINNKKKDFKIVDSYYTELSGTSMSTPIVCGAIALLLQKYQNLTPNKIKYMLKKSCQSLNHPQNHQGWGLIDIERLISKEVQND